MTTAASIERHVRSFAADLIDIRRDLHAHPELAFEETRTSEFLAGELRRYGYEVEHGLAGTGVVGSLKRGPGTRAVAIRADMDALPIEEATGLAYASRTPGKMHACGHDGHVTMALGAARCLAEAANFNGTVRVIFQPAEEDISGAKRMVEQGLFERLPCDAVFALHNLPGFPAGQFAFREGAFMAAADVARIVIHGRGGHCAEPHKAIDPIVVGAAIVVALQTALARRMPPESGAVVTVSTFHAGTISNVIPETAVLDAAVRCFSDDDRDVLEALVRQVCHEQAATFGATAEILYERGYPSTINTAKETAFARRTAVACAGSGRVVDLATPFGLAEDFAYMLQKRPGCYLGLGIGNEPGRPPLHSPQYDFNDDCLVLGATFWTKLAVDYLG
jgi:hippurate hydrolase